MYSCPNCGAATWSFWAKVWASDLRPQTCSNCGRAFAAKVWPVLLLFVGWLPVAILCTFATLRWETSWPALTAIVFLLVGFVVTRHVAQLTPSTARRTQIASFLSWVALLAFAAWVAYRVLSYV